MSMPGAYLERADSSASDSDFVPRSELSEELEDLEFELEGGADVDDDNEDVDMEDDSEPDLEGNLEAMEAIAAEEDTHTEPITFEVDRTSNDVYFRTGRGRHVLTAGALRTNPGLAALLRQYLTNGTTAMLRSDDEEEEEEDDDPYDQLWGVMYSRRSRNAAPIFPVRTEPDPKGAELLKSGEFGRIPHRFRGKRRRLSSVDTNIADILRRREGSCNKPHKQDFSDTCVPNSVGVEVCRYSSNMYCGQYSDDGSFYYTCGKDFKIRIYDTTVPPLSALRTKSVLDSTTRPRRSHGVSRWSSRIYYDDDQSLLSTIKTVSGHDAYSRWTITSRVKYKDANLSPTNDALIYSSIGPVVNFVRTKEGHTLESMPHDARDHVQLNFSTGNRRDFGIWSIRFSADAKEIVAGANQGYIFVYDLEEQQTVLRLDAHDDDVNAVCFADTASSNILVSGSDDSLLKVWDRRSLQGQTPSGVLVGHTEGLTFVASKGDGRYVVSNGKDQTTKLWDLRMMYSASSADRLEPRNAGVRGWDYRRALYVKPRYTKHPNDVSVCTYTGHSVLQTLIRCNFSPQQSTGQRYIYSGSADGRIHIWNLDGTINTVIDRRDTLPLNSDPFSAPASSAKPEPTPNWKSADGVTVRDVSWHPSRPEMMSVSWEDRMGNDGAVVLHTWASQSGPSESILDP